MNLSRGHHRQSRQKNLSRKQKYFRVILKVVQTFLHLENNPFLTFISTMLLMVLVYYSTQVVSKVFVNDPSAKEVLIAWKAPLGAVIGGALAGIFSRLFGNKEDNQWKKTLKTLGNTTVLVALVASNIGVIAYHQHINDICYGLIKAQENQILVNIAYYRGQNENTDNVNSWATVLRNEISQTVKDQDVELQRLPQETELTSAQDARAVNQCTGALLTIWWGDVTDKLVEVHYENSPKSNLGSLKSNSSYVRGTDELSVSGDHLGVIATPDFSVFVESGGDTEYLISVLAGNLQYLQENFQAAYDLYTNAIRLAPVGVGLNFGLDTALWLRGLTNYSLGNMEFALLDFDQAYNLNHDVAVLALKGYTLYHLDKYDEALAVFAEVISLKPDLTSVYAFRAELFIRLLQLDLAKADIDEGLNLSPNDPSILVQLGQYYFILDNLDLAIESWLQALRYQPESYFILNNLGMAYSWIENYDQAKFYFNEALKFSPESSQLYSNLGQVYSMAGDFITALQYADQAIQLAPEAFYPYYIQASIYDKMGQSENALNSLNMAIERGYQISKAFFFRGRLNMTLHRYVDAIVDWSTLIEMEPTFADAYYNRANAFYELGQLEMALDDLEMYQKIAQAENPAVTALIAELKVKLGR